ncbi:PREDICTED: extracellular serine/threonine protein kinase four-jointed [Drosophila arizonae]|uniref:Extracellular serine/threonine protein kinase four-jointed n=1 Tax=Drosophila arizonae TaxID=7263 RepID=A0ABM1PNE8_DROAR|nr:PREDICTED: extracellular serine/threonine protein kinase four-jointed [Drosophila arizonae]
MYDIKRLEAGQQQLQQQQQPQIQQQQPIGHTLNERLSGSAPLQLTCSVITPTPPAFSAKSCSSSPIEATHMTLLTLRRRRAFQRRACLLSILAAFVFGMALGVIVPMLGLPDYFASTGSSSSAGSVQLAPAALLPPSEQPQLGSSYDRPPLPYSVSFVKEEAEQLELSAEQVFRNAFHLEQDKNAPDSMIVKKLDTNDGSIKEFHVQRTANGRYRKGPERRLTKTVQPERSRTLAKPQQQALRQSHENELQTAGIIDADIYWGELVEQALPQGFAAEDQHSWERYVTKEGQVVRLEHGCGRMQNRLVVFADGTRACARYRQNTDQIQGEIFSYYLGQLLNITNLAPSAATVIDTTTASWSTALGDITQAQWKEHRPVVLTRWLPDLEPAGIPQPFQPLERHLNKYDVWNITQEQMQMQRDAGAAMSRGLLKRLEVAAASGQTADHQSSMLEESSATASSTASPSPSSATSSSSSSALLQRLIELAQWSDLIVFDYLIANLDRVVNNLYNFQWNADIMAAPAHNLARQSETQLLVFLDNESGLLHGYRLLKKYEAYHSLLLDNLCIFRRPTIEALRRLRAEGAGRQLRELFERTTSPNVRDVLPSLPDKSIKILAERIDRVLAQVHKCGDSNKSS